MRCSTLRAAVAVITLTIGMSAARLCDAVRKSLAAETPRTISEEPRGHAPYTPTLSAEHETARQEILEILRQYDVAQTRHDAAFFERVEADSFILTEGDGTTRTRAEAIALMKTWDKNLEYTSDDFDVRFYGDVATVAGRMTETHPSGYRFSWRWVDLFARRDGRWQILSTTIVN